VESQQPEIKTGTSGEIATDNNYLFLQSCILFVSSAVPSGLLLGSIHTACEHGPTAHELGCCLSCCQYFFNMVHQLEPYSRMPVHTTCERGLSRWPVHGYCGHVPLNAARVENDTCVSCVHWPC